MPVSTAQKLRISRWIGVLAAVAVTVSVLARTTEGVWALAWAAWPYVLLLAAGLISDHIRAQALATGTALVVSALSIAIYLDAAGSTDAQLGIGLAIFPVVQAGIGVALLGVLALFKVTIERRASNSALDRTADRRRSAAADAADQRGR